MDEEEEREVSLPRKVEVLAQWGSEVSKGHDADLGRSAPPFATACMRPGGTLQPPLRLSCHATGVVGQRRDAVTSHAALAPRGVGEATASGGR